MKKILIISDGKVGEHFIQRVVQTYTTENIYYVIQTKEIQYEDANPARFKFFSFDPTSFYKLSNILKMEFVQVIIAMQTQMDVEVTIKNIRTIKKSLRIVVLDKWDIDEDMDPNIIYINTNEILSSRLLDYLPNVPVIAQNVGLGEGEIMEVLVPFGSSFVYKHIGVIEQKNWKIVAIYRKRKLILPTRRTMIQPNDLLLLVGESAVLKSVYRAIKRELGQFPEPFGSNLYLYIDMKLLNLKTAKELVQKSIFVHKKFNQDLYIKIVNPNDFEIIWYIKKFRNDNIFVNVEYDEALKERLFEDIRKNHIGLIITSSEIFADYELRNSFFELQKPVLKISNKPLDNIKEVALILSDNRDLEKISASIFDISEQMELNIHLYNYLLEDQEQKEQVIEHYYNLATIFSKSIKIIKENENSIISLRQKENFVHMLPFSQKIIKRRLYSLFSTDSEKLYHKLDQYHQVFIPI